MLHAGLVSVTFRKLPPREVVSLAKQAGLYGIEWNGDVHLPPGDLGIAREIRELTLESGLYVAAYGSYYRVGQTGASGPSFEQVLETAVELGAPTVRVWPGTVGSDVTDDEVRWKIIQELRRIADLAAKARITISLEFHGGTLTDTNESASQLLVEVDHPNVFTYWQPHNGEETAECVEGLRAIVPRLSNVHVFHWWPTDKDRLPLEQGEERWTQFLDVIDLAPGDRHLMLEFVPDDSPDAFLRDAALLKKWILERKIVVAG